MTIFRSAARALGTGLDGLTALTGRLNDRVEAGWTGRTRNLRAREARRSNRDVEPLPVLDAPIDLTLRGGIKDAA